jgi:hypothetical protein
MQGFQGSNISTRFRVKAARDRVVYPIVTITCPPPPGHAQVKWFMVRPSSVQMEFPTFAPSLTAGRVWKQSKPGYRERQSMARFWI